MSTRVAFDRRFRGPLTSTNGGYAAGMLAAYLDDNNAIEGGRDAVEVTLRLPPPLDTPLEITAVSDHAALVNDGQVLAVAARGHLDTEPTTVSPDQAAEATKRNVRWGDPVFAECFSCGIRPEHDNLAIHPGPVAGMPDVVAAPWIAREASVPVVWSAIDCSGAYAVSPRGRGEALLGRMTARIIRLPDEGEPCVVVGWRLAEDGRKLHAGTALHTADGTVLAASRQVWIAPH
ncbi:MAG: hypothetical protein ABWZ26_08055 [Candidatus Nanopelagicales bacterium]